MPIPAALKRRREYAGPALFTYGFRPFFLAAGLWAVFGILFWLPQYMGVFTLPTHLTAIDWHTHEMLYGYVAAAVAGFLLTAIPNWTGRLPVSGWPLAGLAFLWLAGRAAILWSAQISGVAAALIDASFLIALAIVAAREIIVGENWRNLRVLIILGVLIVGNIVFHAEVFLKGSADYGNRISIAAVILLISLIGGRIVPSFTSNWLARNNPGRRPVPFSRFDLVTIATSAIALLRLDRRTGASHHGRAAADRRMLAVRASRALGRRPHICRPSGAGAACRLRLCAAGIFADGCIGVPQRGPAECRRACLDCRRYWPHDAGSNDTGDAWPHGSVIASRTCNARHLRCGASCGAGSDHRGFCWID